MDGCGHGTPRDCRCRKRQLGSQPRPPASAHHTHRVFFFRPPRFVLCRCRRWRDGRHLHEHAGHGEHHAVHHAGAGCPTRGLRVRECRGAGSAGLVSDRGAQSRPAAVAAEEPRGRGWRWASNTREPLAAESARTSRKVMSSRSPPSCSVTNGWAGHALLRCALAPLMMLPTTTRSRSRERDFEDNPRAAGRPQSQARALPTTGAHAARNRTR